MYQVIGTDGQIYGPVDVETLRLWKSQGKLTPHTIVIDPITTYSGPAGVVLRDLEIFEPFSPPVVQAANGLPAGFPVSQQMMTAPVQAPVEADLFSRFLGLFLDGLIGIPLELAASVPFLGLIFAPMLCFYWLSRDAFFGGQSIGKRITRTRVVRMDGAPISWGQSAIRNIVYLPLLMLVVPGIGEIGWGITLFLAIVDLIFVLVSRRRIGDHLANTIIVKDG